MVSDKYRTVLIEPRAFRGLAFAVPIALLMWAGIL